MAADSGGDSCHRSWHRPVFSSAQPTHGSQISYAARKESPRCRTRLRRATETSDTPRHCRSGANAWTGLVSDRCFVHIFPHLVPYSFLDAPVSEIPLRPILEYHGWTPRDDSLLCRAACHDSCI